MINTWNTPANTVFKLKHAAEKHTENIWDYHNYPNCIEYWCSLCPEYSKLFEPLLVNEYHGLVLLRYSSIMIDNDFWNAYDGFYRECRSLVIDVRNECLVLTPFRKFFNLNQIEEANKLNVEKRLKNAKLVEFSDKLDGSMQSARFYNGHVVLAGSQALDPEKSFRVNIGYSLLDDNYIRMMKDHPDWTFIFELICREDQHIVIYSDEMRGLYLTGIRDTVTGETLPYYQVIALANDYSVKTTKLFKDTSFDRILDSLDDKRSCDAEGFVINIDGYRIKLKYNDYVDMHRSLSAIISPKHIITLIDKDMYDDCYSKLADKYKLIFDEIYNTIRLYITVMEKKTVSAFEDAKAHYKHDADPKTDRKQFADHIRNNCDRQLFPFLMNLYIGKENNYLKPGNRYTKYDEMLNTLQRN